MREGVGDHPFFSSAAGWLCDSGGQARSAGVVLGGPLDELEQLVGLEGFVEESHGAEGQAAALDHRVGMVMQNPDLMLFNSTVEAEITFGIRHGAARGRGGADWRGLMQQRRGQPRQNSLSRP